MTDTITYDAFGNTIAQKTTNPSGVGTTNSYWYADQSLDAATGLYHMGARYYEASAGRFTSRDSYDGNTEDPTTLNHYLYAGGDPNDYDDPSGHEETAVGESAGLSIAETLVLYTIGAVLTFGPAVHTLTTAAIAAAQLEPLAEALRKSGESRCQFRFRGGKSVSVQISRPSPSRIPPETSPGRLDLGRNNDTISGRWTQTATGVGAPDDETKHRSSRGWVRSAWASVTDGRFLIGFVSPEDRQAS